MTSLDTFAEDSPIAPVLPVVSAQLGALILKKHLSTFYTQLGKAKKSDRHLTRLILLNMFQIFQITKSILNNISDYINTLIHSQTNIMQQLKQTLLQLDQNLSPELNPTDHALNLKRKLLTHIGHQMKTTLLIMNFKKIPLKLY